MNKIPDEVKFFLENQGFSIVTTIDKDGTPHNACKGIIKISPTGVIYLLDVYSRRTHDNLKRNTNMSITAVDEHKFKGYCLKGKARILEGNNISPRILKAWEDKLTSRITHRLLKNMREEKGHPKHPEALLPQPEYIIAMKVKEIVDLTPHQLK